jgi:lipoprotein NlpD
VPEPPSVQTAPVRPGAVESRGVESRPLAPPPPPPPAASAPTQPASPAASPPAIPPNTRSTPRGTKIPFSETALADLRAAESAAPAAGAKPPEPPAKSPDAAAKAPEPAARPPDTPAVAVDGEWVWPTSGRVIQSYAESSNKGIALGGRIGDPVLAAGDGRVIFSGNGPRGYGNLVIVKHANELLSVYAHNRTLVVKEGQAVKRGQKIAELGDSGTTSPRLHFEIRQQGKPVDPATILPKR